MQRKIVTLLLILIAVSEAAPASVSVTVGHTPSKTGHVYTYTVDNETTSPLCTLFVGLGLKLNDRLDTEALVWDEPEPPRKNLRFNAPTGWLGQIRTDATTQRLVLQWKTDSAARCLKPDTHAQFSVFDPLPRSDYERAVYEAPTSEGKFISEITQEEVIYDSVYAVRDVAWLNSHYATDCLDNRRRTVLLLNERPSKKVKSQKGDTFFVVEGSSRILKGRLERTFKEGSTEGCQLAPPGNELLPKITVGLLVLDQDLAPGIHLAFRGTPPPPNAIGQVFSARHFYKSKMDPSSKRNLARFNDPETARWAHTIEPQVERILLEEGPPCQSGTELTPCFKDYLTGVLYRLVLPGSGKQVLVEVASGGADTDEALVFDITPKGAVLRMRKPGHFHVMQVLRIDPNKELEVLADRGGRLEGEIGLGTFEKSLKPLTGWWGD